jgi:hypothetical protein
LDGTLTYQWYKNTANQIDGASSIGSSTGAAYTPLTTTAGTLYYYVTVTSTNTDATGTTVKTLDSSIAAITVSDPIDLTGKTTQNEIRDAITADLSKVTGSGTQDDPKVIPLANLDLSSGSNLENLFKGTTAAFTGGEYLSLDLSGCSAATNTVTGMNTSTLDNATRNRFAAITLPATVTTLAIGGYDGAFASFASLKSISGPGVIMVEDYAFYQCSALTTVSLPEATTIGDSAFAGCSALTTVSLSAATTIDGAFTSCTALTSVSLPAATTIGDWTFFHCIGRTCWSPP